MGLEKELHLGIWMAGSNNIVPNRRRAQFLAKLQSMYPRIQANSRDNIPSKKKHRQCPVPLGKSVYDITVVIVVSGEVIVSRIFVPESSPL